MVEGVDNPSNIGGIVRNAAALGWDGLILDHTSADPFARRSLRVAMGTTFSLPHARTTTLADDISALTGFERYALTPPPTRRRSTRCARAACRRHGRRRAIRVERGPLAIATPVRIPMAGGVDSLNAAAATAIACWALRG